MTGDEYSSDIRTGGLLPNRPDVMLGPGVAPDSTTVYGPSKDAYYREFSRRARYPAVSRICLILDAEIERRRRVE